MKNSAIALLAAALTSVAVSCTPVSSRTEVIPQPLQAEIDASRRFRIDENTAFTVIAGDDERRRIEERAASILGVGQSESGTIVLTVEEGSGKASKESYRLNVTTEGIEISSPTAAGVFYGLQTLGQLRADDGSVPVCRIEDEPRFAYRGVMLDLSRHWFGKEHVKRQIDVLSRYKFNRVHLHLTDAAGWRIEIKKHPRLTELAAWRTDSLWKTWWNGGRGYVEEGSEGAYGGYLTHEDVREIVEYARDRYIEIIPEIEIPAHSEEVMAAYPDLSCTKGRNIQGDLCIGNEHTIALLEDVLTEIVELFPSEYIHIGGDEAAMNNWKSCPLCRALMQKEGMQDVRELQSYIIGRMQRFLERKGRKIIVWDEILEGSDPEAVIMCWHGVHRGIKAAEEGHDVIMTPGEFCYFDSYQDAPYSQPEAIGGYLPFEKVYSYEPVPESTDCSAAKHIIGVQGNLWAEYIPSREHAEYMLYPRALALSEVAWSRPERKNFDEFRTLAAAQADKLRSEGINAFDLSTETGNREEAQSPIKHKALGKSVIYADDAPYWPGYSAGGDGALTDGIRGGWSYGDRRWQGFVDKEGVDVTIDLGTDTELHFIGADFMQICGPDVFLPAEVIISISENGSDFDELAHFFHEVVRDDAVSFRNFAWRGDAYGRYVRYRAKHGKFGGFLFTDEIVVE
ncbi:MAG: beta-N-acetylhexosaminidase [Alistipes sp.]|nr:beta-N-acetylhexosaminidase [Alistipes sp.]